MAGTSLIEASCASAILAIAIGGLTNIAATSASIHRAGLEKAAAVRALEAQVAAVAASDFANIMNWDGAGFSAGLDGHLGAALAAQKGDADGLPGSITITAPTGDASQLVEVLVRVAWTSPNGPAAVSRRVYLSKMGTGS